MPYFLALAAILTAVSPEQAAKNSGAIIGRASNSAGAAVGGLDSLIRRTIRRRAISDKLAAIKAHRAEIRAARETPANRAE